MVLVPQIIHRREQSRATVQAPHTPLAQSSEISGMLLSFYQGSYLFKALYWHRDALSIPFLALYCWVMNINDFTYDSPIIDFVLINYITVDYRKINDMCRHIYM